MDHRSARPLRQRPLVQEHDHLATRRESHAREGLTVDDLWCESDVALIEEAVLADGPQQVLVVPQQPGRRRLEALNLLVGHGWAGQVPYVDCTDAISLLAAVIVRYGNLRRPLALGSGRPLTGPPRHDGDGRGRGYDPFCFL